MDDINKLLEIAGANAKEGSKSRKYEHRSVDEFVEDLNIQSGTSMIPNELVFYYYRTIWAPHVEDRYKCNKIHFFQSIHEILPSVRKTGQRYLLVSDGIFDINQLTKAKEYDQQHWQKKKTNTEV